MKIVIGGSGYIGSNLCKYFSEKGDLLAGTFTSHPKEGLNYFNLENPDLGKLEVDLKKADALFLCSSICKIDECKKNEEKAYRINVDGTKRVLEQCFEKEIFPVFFSSDYVFDGEKGNYTEEDGTNPCTVYGTHKKIIEDFLSSSRQPFLIARLSKIYGTEKGDGTYFNDTIERLKRGEVLREATDQIFCATYIGDLVKALHVALEKNLKGLYNMASPEFFSRFDLVNMLKSQLKIKTGKILPCSIKDFNFLDSRPLDTSMNIKKFINETGFEFTRMKDCISELEKIIR